MERRTKISHPDGRELFHLADRIAKAENPQRWFDGNKEVESGELPKAEQEAVKKALTKAMEEKLEGGAIRDWVNRNNI
jgi:hypothetical protein